MACGGQHPERSDGVIVICGSHKDIRIDRASHDLMFRWIVTVEGRKRGAISLVAVLRQVREALDPGYAAAASASQLLHWCHRHERRRDPGFGSHRLPRQRQDDHARHLLRQPEFSRTAVIINEFGEIGLDHELIEASEDSVIELATGCLCCKVRTDLAQTLQGLLQRRDEGTSMPFDRIVIETSGLADPAPILHTLMTDSGLAGRLVLGGVVTTIDAMTGACTLEREEVSQKQVAIADRIVLTKLDLPGPRSLVAPPPCGAKRRRAGVACELGRVDAPILFGTDFRDKQTTSLEVHSWLAEDGQGQSHARHDADIKTYAIVRGSRSGPSL